MILFPVFPVSSPPFFVCFFKPPRDSEDYLSDSLEDKQTKAPSYLSAAEESLCVGRVYLQGFVSIFQGFVRSFQAELSERNIQVERKQSRLDPLLL